MSDLLLQSAMAYAEIMQSRYRFTLGWKRKLVRVEISFPIYGYHHLAGFQYAKAVSQLSNKHSALSAVRNGEVTEQMLKEVGVFDRISDRLRAICDLKRVIESNRLLFYFRGNASKWSEIDAEYLMKYAVADLHEAPIPYAIHGDIHFFVNGRDGAYTPASIFVREAPDYWNTCPRLKVLELVEIKNERSRIVFVSPSYSGD